ncbi:MAG: hypothetical protein WAP55_00985 [Minisyncoccia bacterium]
MHVLAGIRDAFMVRIGLKLSTRRMEEICAAVESHLGKVGGVVYDLASFKGRPEPMIWRFPELAGVSAKELEEFSSRITPAMKERLVMAQQPTIDARKAIRAANVAKIRASREAEKATKQQP